jgi:hypothetical protein
LDAIKNVAKQELNSENWLHVVARLTGRSYEQLRVTLLEFLDTDVFNLSPENCISFLDPLIESWDVDLTTFGMEIVLNGRIASGDPKRYEFVERGPDQPEVEPGFKEFLNDSSLSGTATKEEKVLLRSLRFNGKRPTALYYYRELQSLRDPLHFRAPVIRTIQKKPRGRSQPKGSIAPMHKYLEADGIEKQLQLDGRKKAIRRWAGNRGSQGKKQKAKS